MQISADPDTSKLPTSHSKTTTTLRPARRAGNRYLNPVPTKVGGWGFFLKTLYKYFAGREERFPRSALGPFLADARIYATPPASGLRVTWLGHSSILLEIDGTRILIDPVWEPRAAPFSSIGPRRFYPPPLALEELPPIDIVLISHDHYDHLGATTIHRLAQLPCCRSSHWVTSKGVGSLLQKFGAPADRIRELDWTEAAQYGKLRITALPARHFSGRSLLNRFQTLWGSFVIETPKHRVFYGADSGEWEGFAEIGRTYGPFDLTMLEIGAFDPLWQDIHMGPDGALRTFRSMGAHGLFMPIHWGLFSLAFHGWREPIERIFSASGVKLFAPEPGRPSEVEPDRELRSEWWHDR